MAPAKGNQIQVNEWKEEQFALPFVIDSREQFDKAIAEIAAKQIELKGTEAKQAKVISAVQARYAKSLEPLSKEISERFDAAYAWAVKNEASVFGDAKTIALPLAEVSLKACPPSVEMMEGWTIKGVIDAIRRWGRARKYIAVKFELKKRAIIADRDTVKPMVWARRGIAIQQKKSFVISPTANPDAAISAQR